MRMVALVMAGGRGTRLKLPGEKPLLRVSGVPMVERVLKALKESRGISRVVVAVSGHVPKTAERMRQLGVEVIDTPGKGYVADMHYAVKKLGPEKVLVISSDLPFVSASVIGKVISGYEKSGRPALSVMCPLAVFAAHGLSPEYRFTEGGRQVSPVGLNIVDGGRIDEGPLDEEMLVLEDEGLAYNINTVEAAQAAERRQVRS